MAAVVGIASAVMRTASSILLLGDRFVYARQEWKDIRTEFETTNNRYQIWSTNIDKLAEGLDETLKETFKKAHEELKDLEKKLEREENRLTARCCFILSGALFPSTLRTFRQVLTRLNIIFSMIKEEEEAVPLLNIRANRLNKLQTTPVELDPRYVPLKKTEEAIYKALEAVNEHVVVLLHGGPGMGKSSVAHAVSVGLTNHPEPQPFASVIFLECGPDVSSLKSIPNCLEKLLLSTGFVGSDQKGDDHCLKQLQLRLRQEAALIILDDVWNSKVIEDFLELRTPGSKLKILVTTRKAGFWVTSKSIDIEIERLDMQTAQDILAKHLGLASNGVSSYLQEYATKIIDITDKNPLALATVTATIRGIDGQRVRDPQQWRDVTNEITACLKSEKGVCPSQLFDKEYPRTLWATLKTVVDKSLTEDAAELLLLLSMFKGPSIPDDVLRIIYEHYCDILNKPKKFTILRNELQRTGAMINVRSHNILQWLRSGDTLHLQTWSLHGLQKLFLREEKKEQISVHVERLSPVLSNWKESEISASTSSNPMSADSSVESQRLVSMLCDIYIDDIYSLHNSEQSDRTSYRARGEDMNLILKLLYEYDDLTNEKDAIQQIVRKVFMAYVNQAKLDEDGFSTLLTWSQKHCRRVVIACQCLVQICIGARTIKWSGSSASVVKALDGLLNIAYGMQDSLITREGIFSSSLWALTTVLRSINPRDSTFLFQQCPSYVSLVMKILEGDSRTEFKISVVTNLAIISLETVENRSYILQQSPCISVLVSILEGDSTSELKIAVAFAISNISYDSVENISFILEQCPSCISVLVNILAGDSTSELKIQVAGAISNISNRSVENMSFILKQCPSFISVLMNILAGDSTSELKIPVATAIANISRASNDENISFILEQRPSCISELVNILEGDSTSELKTAVALAISNISGRSVENMSFILEQCPSCISVLMNLLAGDSTSKLKISVAQAMINISGRSTDENIPFILEQCLSCISVLVNILGGDSTSELKISVAQTMINILGRSNDENISFILEQCPSCISVLVNILAGDSTSELKIPLKIPVAGALRNISGRSNDENISFILEQCPTCISVLVNILAGDSTSELKVPVAQAISNISCTSVENKSFILEQCNSCISVLVNILAGDSTSKLKISVAQAMINILGKSNDENISFILEQCPSCIFVLVSILAGDSTSELKIPVAKAISNISCTSVENMSFILQQCPSCISVLVNILAGDSTSKLKISVAQAMINISGKSNDEIISFILEQCPSCISVLVNILAGDSTSELKIPVAEAISNISCTRVEKMSFILEQCPACISVLVNILAGDSTSELKIPVVRAIFNISCRSVENISFILEQCPSSIFVLVNILSGASTSKLKIPVAQAIVNILGMSNDENISFILEQCSSCISVLVNILAGDSTFELKIPVAQAISNLSWRSKC
ncbi:hypothetical protein Mapa_002451 [Marchantia paleacea]|nr:hypothetical protein Mapa_002451 [Marchantia paleacea]